MNEDWKREFDQRQYHLMIDQLQRFKDGEISLGSLIDTLKSLLSVLEAADETWKDDFRSEWGVLEVAHAVILDKYEQGLETDTRRAINDLAKRPDIKVALQNLERLLHERIDLAERTGTDTDTA